MDSPNVLMKITERGGGDITSAKVGDPLELRFEIFDPESPYEIFVRDLVNIGNLSSKNTSFTLSNKKRDQIVELNIKLADIGKIGKGVNE